MLKEYKILFDNSDKNLIIPISTNYDSRLNDFDSPNISSYINSIENGEKESYSPIINYQLVYYFFNDTKFPIYNDQWEWTGFDMSIDNIKNIFKKSLFLLEFYDSNNLDAANMQFATTLSVNPNIKTHKGCDITITSGVTTYFSSFTTNDYRNELYNFFYLRDLLKNSNINFDSNLNLNYITLYMKSMFLNAKSGGIQYFINTETTMVTNNMFFYEIRFYENYTYGFFNNNILQSIINLYEY